jgi:hypothetical protein
MGEATFKGLTKDQWLERFYFDQSSGTFTHKIGNRKGKAALNTNQGSGYKEGNVFGKKVYAHRLAFFLYYGFVPEEVDHIDGNRSNNKKENLRGVDRITNCRNKKKTTRNTSGINGVHYCKERKRWVAQIGVDRRPVYLGRYTCLGQAIKARKLAEKGYGFHDNHGRT